MNSTGDLRLPGVGSACPGKGMIHTLWDSGRCSDSVWDQGAGGCLVSESRQHLRNCGCCGRWAKDRQWQIAPVPWWFSFPEQNPMDMERLLHCASQQDRQDSQAP